MSLNNHLIIADRIDGNLCEIDIQFQHGELYEYVYRLGDRLISQGGTETKSEEIVVVGGIAATFCEHSSPPKIAEYRYFRIIIFQNRIISCAETNGDDYESLEANISEGEMSQ